MAPSIISSPPEENSSSSSSLSNPPPLFPPHDPQKPTLYLLDTFHPKVLEFCLRNFNAIPPHHPSFPSWRSKAQYLLVRSSRLTADDLSPETTPNLLAIGKQGVGVDKIDAAACSARGIPILNTPGVNARAVAELVLALASSVARGMGGISHKQNSGASGGSSKVRKEDCKGLILRGRTLGLLGMGNVGREAARIFRGAYGAKILAYDPFLPADAWGGGEGSSSEEPYKRAGSVEEVLKGCDVLSIHVPLTEGTRNLIGREELKMLGKEGILINTARGGIVDEAALEEAVREGWIWGAGLDCHVEEPPSRERYGGMWEVGVVGTPHIGAATEETQMETGMEAARRVLEFARGRMDGN